MTKSAKEMHDEIQRLKQIWATAIVIGDSEMEEIARQAVARFFSEHAMQLLDMLDDAYYKYLKAGGQQ